MQTSTFIKHLNVLIALARRERVALMCAEALPWRCHRSLIADAMFAHGLRVKHIMSETRCQDHSLPAWARVKGTAVAYPAKPGVDFVSDPWFQPEASMNHKKEVMRMRREFKAGDHVEWNSEAGRVRGTIKRKITSEITFKGYTVHASKAEPQYLIASDKTDHQAMHKGSALKRIGQKAAGSTKECRAKTARPKRGS
jgi:hypothetical protein